MTDLADRSRLSFLLDTVYREGRHLLGTCERLFVTRIDIDISESKMG